MRPPERSAGGQWARIEAVLAAAPESQAAKDTVDRLRTRAHAVPGSQALVGGQTAAGLDTERTAARDNKVIMPLILAVVLLVLVALLRALVAPLLVLGTVMLSFGAAGLVLQAIGHPRIFFGLPLTAFLFLVVLGVDYSIFLMTRAREEAGRLGQTQAGVLHALTVTGGVITSAGLVLARPSPRSACCRWSPRCRSASSWPSASCWTPWWSAACWSRRWPSTSAPECGGQPT